MFTLNMTIISWFSLFSLFVPLNYSYYLLLCDMQKNASDSKFFVAKISCVVAYLNASFIRYAWSLAFKRASSLDSDGEQF